MAIHIINGRRIRTDFVYPPIPLRCFDWQAVDDDHEPDDDGNMVVGHGRTEQEAINSLMEALEDE